MKKAERIIAGVEAFKSANPGLFEKIQELSANDHFYLSLFDQLTRKGYLSPRQVESAQKGIERAERQLQWKKEREAEQATFTKPTVGDVVELEGEVLKCETRDNRFGGYYNAITIKDKTYGIVWFKSSARWADGIYKTDIVKGKFTITDVKDTISFAKPPRKAEVVEVSEHHQRYEQTADGRWVPEGTAQAEVESEGDKPALTPEESAKQADAWAAKYAAGEMGPNTFARMSTLAICGQFMTELELEMFEQQLEMEAGK